MISQTIIGKETLPDGRILEYGAKDPTTGQRFERIINAPSPITAPTLGTIEAGLKEVQAKIPAIQAGISELPVKPIEPEVPAKDITLGIAEIPIPTGGAGANTDAFNKSLQAGLDAAKKQYEDALRQQRDDLDKQKADYEAKISDLETKQEVMLETDIKPLLEPFREKLETTERERLKVEENYFANQKSVGELESLLTTGQSEIEALKATPGLAAIKSGQINKKAEDISARAGVLQAVMSARNGQISVAYTLIDRTVEAITNDRKDQLSYYETVFNFYETQKDTAGKKLITLEKEDRDYIKQQIGILEREAELSQDVVNMIKEAMLDPKMATVYEQAGVKLTDTPEEIQKKLSDYSYVQEIRDKSNEMEKDDYQQMTEVQAIGKPEEELVRITDSRGKERIWWKKPEEKKPTPAEVTKADYIWVDELITLNPDATYEDLYSAATQNTTLSPSEIKTYLETKGKKPKEEIEKKEKEEKPFLSTDYFRGLYTADQLKTAAKAAGFTKGGFLGIGVGEEGVKEYLDYLMKLVEQYRLAGKTDAEILNMMK